MKNAMVRVCKAARSRSATPVSRRARLGVESLEDRSLMSISPATMVVSQFNPTILAQTANTQFTYTFTPSVQFNHPSDISVISQILRVNDLTGMKFNLHLKDNPWDTHTLLIQTQTSNADGTASFVGQWDNQTGNLGQVYGLLSHDAQWNIAISCHWMEPNFTSNHLSGVINGEAGVYNLVGHVDRSSPVSIPMSGYDVVSEMPNFRNAQWTLTSNDGKPAHTLNIQTQTDTYSDNVAITGTWLGSGPNSKGTPHSVANAYLYYDAEATIHIHFEWNGKNQLDGTLTYFPAETTNKGFVPAHYHLHGQVTPLPGNDATGTGPGTVDGDWTVPVVWYPGLSDKVYATFLAPGATAMLAPDVAAATSVMDLTNVSFTLTSDDASVSHQIVIQSQAAQADGSATFSGVWDPANADGGQAVTGTLAYDANGNIHLTFSAADGSSLGGTVTGGAGAYHLDGTQTPADGSAPVHLAGDQMVIGV